MFYFYFKWLLEFVTRAEAWIDKNGPKRRQEYIREDKPVLYIRRSAEAKGYLSFVGVIGPIILFFFLEGLVNFPDPYGWWVLGYFSTDYFISLFILLVLHLRNRNSIKR